MKKFNFIGLLMAVVGVFSMTSCQHPYADYTPGPQDTNQGVYFPGQIDFEVTAEDTYVEIPVARNNADGAAEISYRTEADEIFTYGRTVAFADGETESTIKVEFDGSELVMGQKYDIKIQLDQAEATAYAVSEYTFSVCIPEPWNSLGLGIYFDELLCYRLEDPTALQGVGTYVEFEQHAVESHRIRVVNPYGPETVAGMWGGLPNWMTFAEGTHYIEFDVTDPNNVKIAPGENVVELVDDAGNPAAYAYLTGINDGTYDLAFLWDAKYPIVLKDGVIKYPVGGMYLSGFQGGEYLGDFDSANQLGYMQYYLPGVDFVNYDMTAAYAGMKVGADNQTTSAIIAFGFGGDVESFKFTVVEGNITDATAIVEAIVAGSEEYTIYEGNTDTYEYTVPVEGTGMKTVVAVPYAEGEAKVDNALVYAFYFPGLGSAETPQAEIYAYLRGVAELTGNPAYESQFPSDKYAALGIIANADELVAMRVWIGTAEEVNGATDEELLASEYVQDISKGIADIAKNGSVVYGPWEFETGTTVVAVLAFDTIYGATQVMHLEHTVQAAAAEQTGMRLSAKAPKAAVLDLAPATLR
jgi:hypothetical protein